MFPYAAIAFVFGTVYGSFLNVLLWRLPQGQGIGGRSHCRACHQQLAWQDLVPILSFIWLKGRCRQCKDHISIRYPLVEATSGLVLAILVWVLPLSTAGVVLAAMVSLILTSLFFFDFFYFILPDVIVYPGIVIFAIYNYLWRPDWLFFFSSALSLGAFFAIIYAVSKGKWLGLGDVKLAFLVGLILGWPLSFLATVLAIWVGALVGLAMMAFGRANLKKELPLGSFWTAAALATLIFQHAFSQIFPLLFR
ncbi:MAG TPA: prepilin peptidase [Candidatus Paceibacterota bacterium]|nr:prepilin peptidase [Candidatus Paceibacterota bacterium]